jgi:RNA polymerase sporulation-specific sigma factor
VPAVREEAVTVRPVWTVKCERIARSATQGLYLPGAEPDDLAQEARIGVMQAIETWTPGAGSTFESFAWNLARRRALDAVTSAMRVKRRVLNDALSLETPIGNVDTDGTLADVVLFRESDDPLRIVLAREAINELIAAMRELSPWERECVQRCRILGEPYEAVGSHKSVDNALQRAKKKLANAA